MDYQYAWETLKKIITAKKASYEDGSMCSMSEATHKESVCKDILSTMDELEKAHNEDGSDVLVLIEGKSVANCEDIPTQNFPIRARRLY